ncbi:hypothetical protein IMCC9480_1874 [Oxalobacteraceae bacterium IMCC9480]|nr:hypothetical protein IMCC9480_1874 [Oxalobacteraceae bacterium IMCC9480]
MKRVRSMMYSNSASVKSENCRKCLMVIVENDDGTLPGAEKGIVNYKG